MVVSLGQNIKRLRWEAGLQTQKALADLLGVPQPQVSDWENDRYAVLETLTLVKIAKGLRCSVDQLLAGIDVDYDRVREVAVAAGHELANVDFPSEALADVPVVAEGERVPEGVTLADRDGDRPGIAQWIRRPGGPARSEGLRRSDPWRLDGPGAPARLHRYRVSRPPGAGR